MSRPNHEEFVCRNTDFAQHSSSKHKRGNGIFQAGKTHLPLKSLLHSKMKNPMLQCFKGSKLIQQLSLLMSHATRYGTRHGHLPCPDYSQNCKLHSGLKLKLFKKLMNVSILYEI